VAVLDGARLRSPPHLFKTQEYTMIHFGRAPLLNVRSRRSFLSMKKRGNDIDKKRFTKSNLPVKTCEVCERPFEWRKKWEKNWPEVKYCSERCRRGSKAQKKDNEGKAVLGNDGSVSSDNVIMNSSSALQNVYARSDIARFKQSRQFFSSSIAASVVSFLCAESTTISAARAAPMVLRPSQRDLDEVFLDLDTSPFSAGAFRRLDESADAVFYTSPRFVEHIDDAAVTALVAYHTSTLTNLRQQCQRGLDVLDLCTSWVSHLPVPMPPSPTSTTTTTTTTTRTTASFGITTSITATT